MRQEAFVLWQKLNELGLSSESVRNMTVLGSPGVGKSCIVWGWALRKVFVENKRVLWIRVYKNRLTKCVRMVEKSIEAMDSSEDDFFRTADRAVEDTAIRFQWDIIILDGITELINKHISMLCRISSRRQTITILIASGSLKQTSSEDRADRIVNHEVLPWSMEEYKIACGSPLFLKSVEEKIRDPEFPEDTTDDMLERKYFYAGVSARWMFEFTVDEITSEVNMHVSQIVNKADFLKGKVGERSMESKNHLLMKQITSKNRIDVAFVSAFVVRFLLRGEGLRGVKLAYNVARNLGNPAVLGSIMEMDFLFQLEDVGGSRSEQGLFLQDLKGRKVGWAKSEVIEMDFDRLDNKPFELDTWVKPRKWNQGGYDLVRVSEVGHGEHHVEFAQVTSNKKGHSVKLREFRKLVDAIINEWKVVVTYVTIYMVIPRVNQNTFEMKESAVESAGVLSPWKVYRDSTHWLKGKEASLIKVLIFYPTS